jgi:hypothetical protein
MVFQAQVWEWIHPRFPPAIQLLQHLRGHVKVWISFNHATVHIITSHIVFRTIAATWAQSPSSQQLLRLL